GLDGDADHGRRRRAGRGGEGNQRAREAARGAQIERLCRYITRPPLSQERLTRRADGRLELELKRVWRDGTRALVLVAAALCAGPRRSHSPLSPDSWPRTAWAPALHRCCTDPLRASSLCRSRADLGPSRMTARSKTSSAGQRSFAAWGSEPQSAGPKGSSA